MRRPQFSLKMLLLLMAVVAAFCAFGHQIYRRIWPWPQVIKREIVYDNQAKSEQLLWSDGSTSYISLGRVEELMPNGDGVIDPTEIRERELYFPGNATTEELESAARSLFRNQGRND